MDVVWMLLIMNASLIDRGRKGRKSARRLGSAATNANDLISNNGQYKQELFSPPRPQRKGGSPCHAMPCHAMPLPWMSCPPLSQQGATDKVGKWLGSEWSGVGMEHGSSGREGGRNCISGWRAGVEGQIAALSIVRAFPRANQLKGRTHTRPTDWASGSRTAVQSEKRADPFSAFIERPCICKPTNQPPADAFCVHVPRR